MDQASKGELLVFQPNRRDSIEQPFSFFHIRLLGQDCTGEVLNQGSYFLKGEVEKFELFNS